MNLHANMKRCALAQLLLAVVACALVQADPVKSGKASAEILVQHKAVPVGGETLVALKITPDAGWHTYWKNPGESGMPTSIQWKLPEGVSLSSLNFPTPVVFEASGMKSLGYEGEVILTAYLKLAIQVQPGPLVLEGKASWLACTDEQCIAGDANLKATIEVLAAGQPAQESAVAKQVLDAHSALPEAATNWQASYQRQGDQFQITIVPPKGTELLSEKLAAYVAAKDTVADGHHGAWKHQDGTLVGTLPVSEYLEDLPESFPLLLVEAGDKDGRALEFKCVKSDQ